MSERLTPAELGDMLAALEALNAAQAVWAFVVDRLALRYGLQAGDEIATDGTIKRSPLPNE